MKKTEITVRYSTGNKKVLADVYGPLCIHRNLPDKNGVISKYWTVTHVKSELKFCSTSTKKDAKAAITEALKLYDFDFETRGEFSALNFELKKNLYQIVKKYRA